MATRRDWLSGQFQIGSTDKPGIGLIATVKNLCDNGVANLFATSDNLFLKKLGKAVLALAIAELPKHLVSEREGWEKAVAEARKEVIATAKKHKHTLSSKRKALVSTNLFSGEEIAAMLDGLSARHAGEHLVVQERIDTAHDRIKAIGLYPVQTVNADFLDKFGRVSNPNGEPRTSVNGNVYSVKVDNGITYFVAITDKNDYRIYSATKELLADNTDFPNESINSKTKAKKVVYILHHKGKDRVDGYTYGKVAAGGIVGVDEYSTTESFK